MRTRVTKPNKLNKKQIQGNAGLDRSQFTRSRYSLFAGNRSKNLKRSNILP